MNKQALAFLTLFSLILMLSVYYVTLPTNATAVMSDNPELVEEKKTDTNEERTSLQEEANKKKDEEITQNSNTVSSSDSSEADKQKAIETIDELKDAKSMQDEIAKQLNEAGFMSAVEIMEDTCMVTIFDQEEDAKVAKKIMNIVQEKVNQQYLIEVTFK